MNSNTSYNTISDSLVVFALDDQQYALPLASVERIVRAVEITPVPGASRLVLGIVNAQGNVIPVLDTRRWLGLHECALDLSDRFIIARAGQRKIALVVDNVRGVTQCGRDEMIEASDILPGIGLIKGVIKRGDGLILIVDYCHRFDGLCKCQ